MSAIDDDDIFRDGDDIAVVGDWDADGVDTVGVFRDGEWLIKNSHRGGNADQIFHFGSEGDLPIVWGDNS